MYYEQKEFRKHTPEQLHDLKRNVEYNSLKPSFHNNLKPIADEVVKFMGSERYRKEATSIVTGFQTALRYGQTKLYLPLDKRRYSQYNKSVAPKYKLDYTKMSDLVHYLAGRDYIHLFKGFTDFVYNDEVEGVNYTSIIQLRPEFHSLYTKKRLNNARSRELDIILMSKSYRKKHPVTNMIRKYKTVEVVRNLKGLGNLRSSLRNHNYLLDKTVIKLNDKVRKDVCYKMVLHNENYLSGRRYTMGSFQSEPSHLRETITLDGVACTECDFDSSVMSMFREILQLPVFEGDSYRPLGVKIPQGVNPEEYRSFCKIVMFCILFSPTKSMAESAIRYTLVQDLTRYTHQVQNGVVDPICNYKSLHFMVSNKYQDKYTKGIKNKQWLADIINGLRLTHNDIIDAMDDPNAWIKYQFMESQITNIVLDKFTSLGFPSLTYHDSMIVQKPYQEFLMAYMQAAWKSVLGSNDHCTVSVEF